MTAIIPAITQAGITPVVKHWPGIGSGTTDPHKALDKVADIDALRAKDLIPFDAAIAANVPGGHGHPRRGTGPDRRRRTGVALRRCHHRRAPRPPEVLGPRDHGLARHGRTSPSSGARPNWPRRPIAGSDIALLSGADVAQAAHAAVTDAIREGRLPRDQSAGVGSAGARDEGRQGQCLDAVARFSSLTRTASSTTTPGTVRGPVRPTPESTARAVRIAGHRLRATAGGPRPPRRRPRPTRRRAAESTPNAVLFPGVGVILPQLRRRSRGTGTAWNAASQGVEDMRVSGILATKGSTVATIAPEARVCRCGGGTTPARRRRARRVGRRSPHRRHRVRTRHRPSPGGTGRTRARRDRAPT